MHEITVKIPDGDYCEDCKFMEHYDYPLVNIMGDETGAKRSGYKCRQYDYNLEVEDFGCYQKIKKCFWCTMSEKEKMAMAVGWLVLFGGFNDNKEMDNK